MEVTAQTFPYHLPRMLEDLASSVFVAIDLEFSGIAIGTQGKAGPPQTLQQRYEEVKESAGKYQILQVGLTFCHEDTEGAKYSLRPYNLYLSPVIDRKLEVERNWSMQSSAIEFLLDNKFSMDSLFKIGVQYISREEEAQALSKAAERQAQTTVRTSLGVKETDHESLVFLDAARKLVDDWLALGDKRDDYLNIPPPTGKIQSQTCKAMPSVLNRFQKRLVHQLIEVEYPGFVTVGRPSFVQIIEYDETREKAVHERRMQFVQERAWKQTGFRWMAEALAGGDLVNLSPNYFSGIRANAPPLEQGETLDEFVDAFKKRLKTHRPILVGHNLFMDLIYFFRCFFGPLPDRVEDFQAMAHEHFPVLIDTKYLATHDCGSINPTSSLQEINEQLLQIPKPAMSIHPHFARYHLQRIDHEAGYDSLLTAQVFIRLSAQLEGDRVSTSTKATQGSRQIDLNDRFAQIQIAENEELSKPEAAGEKAIKAPGQHTRSVVDEIVDANEGRLIPRPGSQFWTIFGNKLRVFGTEERICQIG